MFFSWQINLREDEGGSLFSAKFLLAHTFFLLKFHESCVLNREGRSVAASAMLFCLLCSSRSGDEGWGTEEPRKAASLRAVGGGWVGGRCFLVEEEALVGGVVGA